MPRVNLGVSPDRRQAAQIRKIIRTNMAKMDIRHDSQVAESAGMLPPLFCKRLKAGGWRVQELIKIAKYLRFSAEDAAAVLGLR
ncbi:MAG: hypothetical protein VB078_00235 [Clostridiaceae bacterium]|nr:hypothetical protein [Clostridiaceae bacterium]